MGLLFGVAVLGLFILDGCGRQESNRVQGYAEGEFVYVASPLAGILEKLYVQRGDQVSAGDLLFDLDNTPEKAARDEAQRRLAQARANLEDAIKARRPSEIESIQAQLKQARAALSFSEIEFARQQKLLESGAVSTQAYDRAQSTRDQDRERVAQLEADLETANLGSRTDQIKAAEENVRAQEATLVRAEWDLSQKRQSAPQAGVIFEPCIARENGWGRAVQWSLYCRRRTSKFVRSCRRHRSGPFITEIRVRVTVDGVKDPFIGKVSFISPRAEFTPPVIYSQEARSKLVFMIEVRFDPAVAKNLHPGQPVDVQFGS